MYKKILVVAIASASVMACSSEPSAVLKKDNCVVERAVPGGWQSGEVNEMVKGAVKAALQDIAGDHNVDDIISVHQQVVAGMNYDIDFRLDNGDVWNAKVFRSLDGTYNVKDVMLKPLISDNCR